MPTEGRITIEGHGEVTADDFDKSIAAGLRRRDYIAGELEKRLKKGQQAALEADEVAYHRLALYAIRVLADDLRGDDTPLSLLEEAAPLLDLLCEEPANQCDKDEALELLDRMRAVIRRLT